MLHVPQAAPNTSAFTWQRCEAGKAVVSQSCTAGIPGAHPGMGQPGLRGRVAPGSAPPQAHPQGLFLPLPGPAAFPRATHVCRAPGAALPSWCGSSEQGGIPLARKQPQGWGWMRHSGLGYPACCLSQHGAAACPGLTVAPDSLALPRAHPAIPIACPYGSWGCSSQQLRGCWGDINIIPALSGTPL